MPQPWHEHGKYLPITQRILNYRFDAGGVARLQSAFDHGGEDGLVLFGLKRSHAVCFVDLYLDRGQLSGRIRTD